MYKNLLLLTLSLMTCAANAQSRPTIPLQKIKQLTTPDHRRSANLNRILQNQFRQQQNKTTAAHERLISQGSSINNSGWQLFDSTNYIYSNARGSVFNLLDMYYSDYPGYYTIQYDSTATYSNTGSNFDLSNGATAIYDASGRRTTSTYLTSSPSGTPFTNSSQTVYKYDAAGNVTTQYGYTWNTIVKQWDLTDSTNNTYNSSNKLTLAIYYRKSGPTWSAAYKTTNTYDGAGNLATSVYARWTAGAWADDSRETFTYTSANKVQTNLSEDYDAGSWMPSSLDSFGYGAQDFYNYSNYQEWNEDSARWDNSYLETRHVNTGGLPDTIYYYEPDSATGAYELSYQNNWTYNASNNPVVSTGEISIFGTTFPILVTNYYYENYWDLGVSKVADKNTFSVYPNPANDVLNIRPAKAITGNLAATITNVAGQLVLKSEFAPSQNISLSIGALQPGTYVLNLADAKGNQLHTQSVVKQ